MAQAFKFPTEADSGPPRGPALGSLAQASRLVESPLPTAPVEAGSIAGNMGPPLAPRKRAKVQPMGPQRSRFPFGRSSPRLINPDRFDKVSGRSV